ncbi:PA2169 family four-helix-bundle protein [Stenotrophomonas sp. TWI1149]|uniref:PA2169 family four-helix-bundle protein n=1 Tax=unclassified Stenotrophomonas TaxID=196198 RepID=UPI00320ABB2C
MSTVQSGHAIRELNQIIGIARDGHDIYARAVADGAQDPQLNALMMRMAAAKVQVIDGVTRLVRDAGGQPARHGTFAGSLRGGFGRLGTALGDAGIQYASESQAAEARLVRALEVAARDGALTAHARRTLNGMLLETRLGWDDMRQEVADLRGRDA